MTPATMRKLRQFHLYIGVFFAPAILFFAISGGLQAFRLQQASGWDGAPPPQWMAWMGSVHIDQRLPEGEPAAKKPPAPADPAKVAARKAKAAKALPMKIFTAALGIALAEDLKRQGAADILAALSAPGASRPRLVIGFAAETDDMLRHAQAKRTRKGCDWIVANDVRPETGIMGGELNEVHLVTPAGVEAWPLLPKSDVAGRLALRIAEALG